MTANKTGTGDSRRERTFQRGKRKDAILSRSNSHARSTGGGDKSDGILSVRYVELGIEIGGIGGVKTRGVSRMETGNSGAAGMVVVESTKC